PEGRDWDRRYGVKPLRCFVGPIISLQVERTRMDNARQWESGADMSQLAKKLMGEKFSPSNFSPIFSEVEAAKQFSAVILNFSTGDLAQATRRSKETAKCWKAGRAFPNGVSLMALVREFPEIRAWVRARTGEFDDPRSLDITFSAAEQLMQSD